MPIALRRLWNLRRRQDAFIRQCLCHPLATTLLRTPPTQSEYPAFLRELNAASHKPRLPPGLEGVFGIPVNTGGIDQSLAASSHPGQASPSLLQPSSGIVSDVDEPDSILSMVSSMDDSDDNFHSPKRRQMANGVRVVQVETDEPGADYDAHCSDHISLLKRPSMDGSVDYGRLHGLHSGPPDFNTHPITRDRAGSLNVPPMTTSAVDCSDSDLDEPEVREFIRRQREIKRKTRLSHGSSIGKRPFSDRDDQDEDMHLRYHEGDVFMSDGGSFSGDRRTRRRVGERRSGVPSDQILELDEPEDAQQFDYELDRQMPFHGFNIPEISLTDRCIDNGVPL